MSSESNRLSRASPESAADGGEEGAGQIFQAWGIIRRRKKLLTFGLVSCLTLAAAFYLLVRRTYEARVEILVVQKDANLPARGVEREHTDEPATFNDLLATHVQLFKSPRIIQQAIDKHHLEDLPTFVEAKEKAAGRPFRPIDFVLNHLRVSKGGEGQGKDARVIRAGFRGHYRDDCTTILQALVESYQGFLGATFQSSGQEALKLISQAKLDLEAELQQAEEGYRRFREQTPLLSRGDQRSINPHDEQLREIDTQLTRTRLRKAEVQTRLDVVREALRSGRAHALGDLQRLALIGPEEMQRITFMLTATRGDASTSEAFQSRQPVRTMAAEAEYRELLSLMLREREMLQDHGRDHPDVLKIQQQIETARNFLARNGLPLPTARNDFTPSDLLNAQVALLEYDVGQLQKQELQMIALAAQEGDKAKQVVSAEIRDEMLRDDIVRKRGLYDTVVDRLRRIDLIKDYGGILTQVIGPVETPYKPVFPLLWLVGGVGGFLGLFVGGGMAYVADLSDRTFRTPHELCAAIELPLLGEMPAIPAVSKAGKDRVAAGAHGKKSPCDSRLVSYHAPASREADALRRLRTALRFATRRGEMKIVQVTSPAAGDGKSVLAANLAVSLAQSGKKVLLIDADLRHPTIAPMFALAAEAGLAEAIQGTVEWSRAVQPTEIPGLAVLPAGPCPENPAELLLSPQFERILAAARQQYDCVVVDSPPVNPVPDSLEIAARVDGVLLILRIKKNGAPVAVQSRRALADADAKLLGVVVNEFQKDHAYRGRVADLMAQENDAYYRDEMKRTNHDGGGGNGNGAGRIGLVAAPGHANGNGTNGKGSNGNGRPR